MSSSILRAGLGVSFLAVLAACGSDSNGSTGVSAETTFPAMMTETFGSTGAQLANFATSSIGFGGANVTLAPGVAPSAVLPLRTLGHLFSLAGNDGPLAAAALQLVYSPGCTPDITGGATDTDGDGVPNDITYTYTAANCTQTDTATGDVNLVRGVIRYRDTNDALYGFESTITGFRIDNYNGSSHDWQREIVDDKETANTTASGGAWNLNVTVDATTGTADTVKLSQRVIYNVHGSFASATAIPAGGPLSTGDLTLSGSIDATLPQSGRLVMDIANVTTPHYTSACGGFVSGVMDMRLNGNVAEGVRIKWIGCDTAAWEYLGSGVL